MKEYTIDAKNRSLGRVAAEAASVLRGKNDAAFKSNKAPEIILSVINTGDIKITGQKLKNKKYSRYSGYPGGLTYTAMEKTLREKGIGHIFKETVEGMLPKNKLKNQMIKNLIIK